MDDALRDQAKQYTKAKGVEVSIEFISYNDLPTKTAAAVESGAGPERMTRSGKRTPSSRRPKRCQILPDAWVPGTAVAPCGRGDGQVRPRKHVRAGRQGHVHARDDQTGRVRAEGDLREGLGAPACGAQDLAAPHRRGDAVLEGRRASAVIGGALTPFQGAPQRPRPEPDPSQGFFITPAQPMTSPTSGTQREPAVHADIFREHRYDAIQSQIRAVSDGGRIH